MENGEVRGRSHFESVMHVSSAALPHPTNTDDQEMIRGLYIYNFVFHFPILCFLF